jgi:hypothetical protein
VPYITEQSLPLFACFPLPGNPEGRASQARTPLLPTGGLTGCLSRPLKQRAPRQGLPRTSPWKDKGRVKAKLRARRANTTIVRLPLRQRPAGVARARPADWGVIFFAKFQRAWSPWGRVKWQSVLEGCSSYPRSAVLPLLGRLRQAQQPALRPEGHGKSDRFDHGINRRFELRRTGRIPSQCIN